MVAQIFASAIAAMQRCPSRQIEDQREVLEYILGPFETFSRELWWDVARNPAQSDLESLHLTGRALEDAQRHMEEKDEQAQALLRQSLCTMVQESYHLLNQVFSLGELGLTDRLSEEYVARSVVS